MQKKEITKLIKQEESETFERKKSVADQDRITEVVCSFANSKGGKVLVGVNNKGKLLGVNIGDQTVERLTNRIIDNIDPKIYPEITTLEIENKNLILISTKAGEHQPHTAFGRGFKRAGNTTKLMFQSEYERLLLEKNRHKMQFDAMECKRATLKDVSKEKVKEFLATAKRERGLKIDLKISLKEALSKLELLTDKNKLTNAAILMFAKEPQRFLRQSEVRCAKFKGTEPVKPFIDMKVLGGTIDNQVSSVEQFILNNIRMAAWLEPGKIQRSEKWEYPLDAIREAVVNAICHRDYTSTANVQVRIFDDRLEVWNPGDLPVGWTIDTLKKKHESKPKNPLIANLFFMIKHIERWGTGTNDMIKKTVKHGLPEPIFEKTSTSIIVTFKKTALQEEDLNSLNERQKKAINYLIREGKITSKKYIALNNINVRTARRDIADMVNRGLLVKRGETQGAYYIIRTSFGQNK